MVAEVVLRGPRAGAAAGAAECLVVLLHGYGADGRDLIGLARALGGVLPTAAFVAPDAPEASAFNPRGRQWFPIPGIDNAPEDVVARSFARSVGALEAFLDAEAERYRLAPAQVALIGFSQGTMMALHVALRRTEPVAAVVGYSGRLIAPERLAAEIRVRPPVLLVHGDRDEMIPVQALHEAVDTLASAGVDVQWHVSTATGHGIDPEGLERGGWFLATRFAALQQ